MAEKIGLKIYTPEKLALDKSVERVLLPDGRLNLTIIADRAPTSLVLEAGVLQILDNSGKVEEKYFVDTGVADVVANTCTISTLHLLKIDKINRDMALEMITKEPQAENFYKMIAGYFENYE